MPRRPRVFIPGGIYHVYNRVARGEMVFDQSIEINRWIDTVAHVIDLHDFTILAWCLMTNHYHLVIRTGSRPLWRGMAKLQGRIAKEFNRRHGFTGRLWQSRYKARLVTDQGDLENLFAYVHLNPVSAGLVLNPSDYAFSGHRELMGTTPPILCDIDSALLNFGSTRGEARLEYIQRMRMAVDAKWLSSDPQGLPWWRRVDDDDETMRPCDAPPTAVDFKGKPLVPEVDLRPLLVDVVAAFERQNSLPSGCLASRGRARLLGWYRCLFATLTVSWMGYRSRDVAQILAKATGSVSRWLNEGLELQRTDDRFRATLEQARAHLDHLDEAGSECSSPDPNRPTL